jgi:hypothetical protein
MLSACPENCSLLTKFKAHVPKPSRSVQLGCWEVVEVKSFSFKGISEGIVGYWKVSEISEYHAARSRAPSLLYSWSGFSALRQ